MRVVLLLDSMNVSGWVWEAVSQVYQEKGVELVLAVVNKNPKASGKKSPLLYRAYRGLDRKLFLKYPDAFAQKDLTRIQGWNTPILAISPVQKKFSDYFLEEDISKIKSYQPDVIIRFGFRILTGEILTLPRLGVWSFHHGDPSQYRGGPPAFWEVLLGWETTGTVLQRITEKLDQGDILYQSCTQTDPLSVQRNANTIFWKSSYFVSRVLNLIEQKGEEKWQELVAEVHRKPKAELKRPPENLQMIALFWQLISRNLRRKIQEKRKPAHWELALVNHTDPSAIKASDVKLVTHSENTRSYLADPFPVFYKGDTYVFAEKYDKQTNKGSIVCGRILGNELQEVQTIIQEDWHLSYPFIFEEAGDYFMIPESADTGKLYFYQPANFPYQWERRGVFFEGEAYDPTVYSADGKYWLFVNQKPHPASSSFDELNLYFSDSLHSPDWKAHPMNPIVSDVRCSRPAGKLFQKEGKLYRPAQDSGKRYGHRIAVQEILDLTETSYSEQTAYFIEPELVKGALGVHTLNFCGNSMFLDFYFRK